MRRALLTLACCLAFALMAQARSLNLEVMPDGYVLSPDEVIDTLGRDVVKNGVANQSACAIKLDDIQAAAHRRDDPPYLLLSNAPEVLNEQTLPGGRGLLASAEVPAGKVRILVSHANAYPLSLDYVLRMSNPSDQIADVLLDPRVTARQNPIPGAFSADAIVGGELARDYIGAEHATQPLGWHPPDGDRHRLIRQGQSSDARLVENVRGLGTAWLTLTTSTPLKLAVYAVPRGGEVGEPRVIARSGSQARGLFSQPDQDVEATVDISSGKITRYVFGGAERDTRNGQLAGGSWMSGTDSTGGTTEAQTNRGDFGGLTYFQAEVKGTSDEGVVGAMFVLVAGGRKAALLPAKGGKPVLVPQWGGLVLGRARIGETFQYEFTLPPNSWAPVYLLAVPVHHM